MGLLSRKKADSKQSAPPAISGPLPTATPPAIATTDYSKKYPNSTGSYGSGYGAPQQQASGLPSPPRSPVEAGCASASPQRSTAKAPLLTLTSISRSAPVRPPADAHQQQASAQSYSSNQSGHRPQNSTSRAGGYGGQDHGYGQSQQQKLAVRDEQQYGGNGGAYHDSRGYGDVEGKMGTLGINGQHARADQLTVGDTDMMDASSGQYGSSSQHGHGGYHDSRGVPQSASARHQQQAGGGYGHQTHASRQISRQPEAIPQVVLSPTPSQTSSVSRKTSSRYSLTDFTFIRTLGTGSFGRVHLVRSQHNQRSYAIKVLSKERVVKMKQVEHTNSEREMLERVRHPFLVNLWGTFKDSKNLYMVMDFVAGGELFSLLRKSQVRPRRRPPAG